MDLDTKKKNRRCKMKRSNSFKTQDVIEIGRKEAGVSKGFPILWIGLIDKKFQMPGRKD